MALKSKGKPEKTIALQAKEVESEEGFDEEEKGKPTMEAKTEEIQIL